MSLISHIRNTTTEYFEKVHEVFQACDFVPLLSFHEVFNDSFAEYRKKCLITIR